MAKRPTKKELWHPVDSYDVQDIRSIQALARYAMGADRPWPSGEEPPVPSPMDVKLMFGLVNKLSQTYEDPAVAAFAAQDQNVVWYMAGRASVGKALTKLMMLKASLFEGK